MIKTLITAIICCLFAQHCFTQEMSVKVLRGHIVPENGDLMNIEVFDELANLTMIIEDVSLQDTASKRLLMKEFEIKNGDRFPIFYEIAYPKIRLIPGNRYNVRAIISNKTSGELLYLTTMYHKLPEASELDSLYPIKVTKIKTEETAVVAANETSSESVEVEVDVCGQGVEIGGCKGYFPMFYYNQSSNQCESFVYGGCQGNDNRFETQEECETKCVQDEDLSISFCSLKADVGGCRGYFEMFYFDIQTSKCLPFIYGGCDGNENRFETIQDCESKCHSASQSMK